LAAKHPISFFIRIVVYGTFKWQDFVMDNSGTNEKMTIKNAQNNNTIQDDKLVIISRYPNDAGKGWIEENEKEVLDWDFYEQNRRIHLRKHMAMRYKIL
jgi:hypothetical protein